jgi:hypothetical protein
MLSLPRHMDLQSSNQHFARVGLQETLSSGAYQSFRRRRPRGPAHSTTIRHISSSSILRSPIR